MSTRVDALKQSEYTGENRCTPCTVVNVCIAAVLSVAAGWLVPLLGVAVFGLSLLAIYFRGYLVPGTPTLTKQYFADRVLALFDKAPESNSTGGFVPASEDGASTGTSVSADDGDSTTDAPASETGAPDPDVVPEQLLADLGVVEPCEAVDDLCLTDDFERSWLDVTAKHRDGITDPAFLAPLFDADAQGIETNESEDSVAIQATGIGRQRWTSEGALLADAAANELLLAEHGRWAALDPHQRLPILKALRSFLPVCPLCDGEIRMGNETVESCCRSWEVVAVACTDCETRYLEVDARRIEGVAE